MDYWIRDKFEFYALLYTAFVVAGLEVNLRDWNKMTKTKFFPEKKNLFFLNKIIYN